MTIDVFEDKSFPTHSPTANNNILYYNRNRLELTEISIVILFIPVTPAAAPI